MGGRGSGRRWQPGAKDVTGDLRRLEVRSWQRDGYLSPGRAFGWRWTRGDETVANIQVRADVGQIILTYRHRKGGAEWKAEEYPVRLVWTPCNFGGQRAWFICPVSGCGKRVAILYGGSIFACRHCHRLVYRCQRESIDDRAIRRADKIRARLDWVPGIANGQGSKPKGMRWRTYYRLVAEHQKNVSVALAGASRKFGIKIEI